MVRCSLIPTSAEVTYLSIYHDVSTGYVRLFQRTFALSKVSGQKAAQYVLQKHPDCFANDTAEPLIEVCLRDIFII